MTDGLMKTGREANKVILSVKKYLIIMSLFMTMHEGEACVNTYSMDFWFVLKLSFHCKVSEFLELVIIAVSSFLCCKLFFTRTAQIPELTQLSPARFAGNFPM